MRYHGQGYEIPVAAGARRLAVLDERFNALHEQLYGFRMPDTPSEIVNLRAIGTGERPSPELPEAERGEGEPGPRRPGRDPLPRRAPPDADLRPRATCSPATGSRARRSSPSSTRPRSSSPGYEAEIDRLLQHPDPPGGRAHEHVGAADRRDPADRDRPDHARHHRERAAPRALRDGRRAVPLGHEPGHPRAARRVPDAHRPAGAHGRRASSAPTSAR